MGKDAKQFEQFKQSHDSQQVDDYLSSLLFKPMNVMVRGKFEYYNNEPKMRFFAVKTFERNVNAENKALLERLNAYSQIES